MQVEARNTLTRCRDIFITPHPLYVFNVLRPLVRDVNVLHKINLAYRTGHSARPTISPKIRTKGNIELTKYS